MIVLHSMKGEPFAINAELIERVEAPAETHVTLVNGTSYVVSEPLEEVVRLHREDRALVQARSRILEGTNLRREEPEEAEAAVLVLVPPTNEEGADRP